MAALKHILFPYDFSDPGRRVTPFVCAMAGSPGTRVTVLSVLPPPFDGPPPGMASAQAYAGDTPAEWRLNLQSRLDGFLVDEFAGLQVEGVTDDGDPALRIVAFAETHNVDVIMMPTHGVGKFRNLLMGSVTAKVLHDARCPVWTAAHVETQSASSVPRRILCAIDESPTAPFLARWACDLSRTLRANLATLHVIGPISDWPALEGERRLQEQLRDGARERIASMLSASGVDAPLRIAVGDIVQCVTEESRQEQADLVIIGRGSIAEPFGRLRTHAFGIIQRSPCPVISV
jgi:nucleotide-binding universal stress UspA family protein